MVESWSEWTLAYLDKDWQVGQLDTTFFANVLELRTQFDQLVHVVLVAVAEMRNLVGEGHRLDHGLLDALDGFLLVGVQVADDSDLWRLGENTRRSGSWLLFGLLLNWWRLDLWSFKIITFILQSTVILISNKKRFFLLAGSPLPELCSMYLMMSSLRMCPSLPLP